MDRPREKRIAEAFLRAGLACATLAGGALRLVGIRGQLLERDEWFSPLMAVSNSYGYIFTHLGLNDYCVPLTLINRAVDQTTGLSELILRIPNLTFGILSIIALPVAVRPLFGVSSAVVFAGLLATNPYLVYMSRLSRPYAISTALSFLALSYGYRYFGSGKLRDGVPYALCAIFAPFFHLSVLFVMLGSVGLGLARGRARKNLPLLAVIVVGWLLLLGPAVLQDYGALTGKLADRPMGRIPIVEATLLLLGFGPSFPALAALGLAAAGFWVGRSRSGLTLTLLAAAGVQLLVPVLVRPTGVNTLPVYARYSLVCLPIFLLFMALGAEHLARWMSRSFRLPGLPVVAALTILLAAPGALKSVHAFPDLFASIILEHLPARRVHTTSESNPPAFYRELASLPPGSSPVVEVYGQIWPMFDEILVSYQRVHRQPVLIGYSPILQRWAWQGENHFGGFRNYVSILDESVLRGRAVRYVIFHLDPRAEVKRYPWIVTLPDAPSTRPLTQDIDRFERRFGSPVYRDESLVVFAVSNA